jgi:predicted short-subunit dehydrogenase-like oxidoreductase (DUF2520 family)
MVRTKQSSTKKSRHADARSTISTAGKKPTVAIIGAGRLGLAMGLALKAAGYKIDVVAARRASTARQAAKAIGPQTLALSADQLNRLSSGDRERLMRSTLVLITTPDDVIADVSLQLARIFEPEPTSKGSAAAHRIVLHTSGALASDVLDPMRRAGFAAGSLHPLVSISESRSGAKSLAHAYFSVEGDGTAIRRGKSIVRDLSGESFTIASDKKALYHAAALTASPNMTALFEIALDMLGVCGVSPGRARRILLPLAASTVKNLVNQNPARALTGTFQRGDIATVRKHLAALRAAKLPDALNAYVVLGQKSISMARKRGTDSSRLDAIARLLSRAPKS